MFRFSSVFSSSAFVFPIVLSLLFVLFGFIVCESDGELPSDVEIKLEVSSSDLSVLAFEDHIDVQITATGGSWEGEEAIGWLEISKVDDGTLRVTYESNLSDLPRSGTIYLRIGEKVQAEVTLVQESAPHIHLSSSPTIRVSYLPSDTTLSVSAEAGVWHSNSSSEWVRLEPHPEEDYLRILYTENASEEERSATIRISIEDILISQDLVLVQSPAPVLSISPSESISLTYLAGDTSLDVSVSDGTAWVSLVEGSVAWLRVSRSDAGKLEAVYDRNSSDASRSATVAVSVEGLPVSEDIVFTQEATSTLRITPSSLEVTSASGSVHFDVSGSSGAFQISPSASDIDWVRSVSLSEDGTSLTAAYTENTLSDARSIDFEVSLVSDPLLSETVTLSQLGAPELSILPSQSISLSYLAGDTSLAVNVSEGSWTSAVQGTAKWLRTSRSDAGKLEAVYDRNDISESRSATVAVSVEGLPVSEDIVFTQEATSTLRITPSSLEVTSASGSVHFDVSGSSGAFQISPSASDIDWVRSVSLSEDGTSLIADYTENTLSDGRSIDLKVSLVSDPLVSETVTLSQAGAPELSILPSQSISLSYLAGDTSLDVSLSSGVWTSAVQESVDWLQVSSPDSKTLKAVYERNDGASSRSATVAVSVDGLSISKEVVFTQAGVSSLIVSPSSSTVSSGSGSVSFSVSGDGGSFQVSPSASTIEWVSSIDVSEDGSSFSVAYTENRLSDGRSIDLKVSLVSDPLLFKTFTLSQSGSPVLSISPSQTISLRYLSGDTSLAVSVSEGSWTSTVQESVDWLQVSSPDSEILKAVYERNEAASSRSATVEVSVDGLSVSQDIVFTQAGVSSLSVSPSSSTVSSGSGSVSFSVSSSVGSFQVSPSASTIEWVSSIDISEDGSSFSVAYTENTLSDGRSIDLKVSLISDPLLSETVTLSQAGAPELSILPSQSISLRYLAGDTSLDVSLSSGAWTSAVQGTAKWLQCE